MTYLLTIITPQALFFKGSVSCLIAPGTVGSLGVLAYHAPLISTLKAGLLKLTLEDETRQVYQIGPGFLDVRDNKATLLTHSIQLLS